MDLVIKQLRANESDSDRFAEELILIGNMVKGNFKSMSEAHDKLSAFYQENKDTLLTMPRHHERSDSEASITKLEETKENESQHPLQ